VIEQARNPSYGGTVMAAPRPTPAARRPGNWPPTRIGLLIAGPLTAGLLIAGCGAPAAAPPTLAATPATAAAPSTTAASAASATLVAAEPTTSTERSSPVLLPWPAATPAETADLQSSVDGGAEPWLLDPGEVAIAYAAAARGWTDAEAVTVPGEKTVEISNGEHHMSVSLTQPGRVGDGGIWVVTAETGGP
jgi:hypothetical protein